MKALLFRPHEAISQITRSLLCLFLLGVLVTPLHAQPPEPFVAIHVSELTQALETMPASPPSSTYTGFQWRYTSWHYFVAYESLKEILSSDGTPFIEVSDSDIASGKLRNPDGSPRYPILISLASEAIADNEISPLRDYVNAGGFVFVGSSSFTRNPDGTDRGDFALASEMGVHMVSSNPTSSNSWNWYENMHFVKNGSHRLTSHIPSGTLVWRGPLTLDDIPWGTNPSHTLHGPHYTETVIASGATAIAQGDSGPYLAVRSYGLGQFIYHGSIQPFLGLGVIDPSMYSYLIYRRAIEWAFETFAVPILKVSPWQYQYDATLIIRHDLEGDIDLIKSLYSSAQYEHALGVSSEFYFCTGALRTYTGSDKASIISNMKSAVSLYGATIGPHNGGLKNPINLSLPMSDGDYWHWGPDEVLDITPPGYANGKAYATTSILNSFKDVEGWLAGVDNGRAGCGAEGNCPRTWAAPYMNSTREDSNEILEQLGSITMGEQKVGPFPHWTLSYNMAGKRFSHLSLPESDWYVGSEIPQALDMGHTVNSIGPAVDFYHSIGGLLNFYGHQPSNTGLEQQYITYSMSKPRLWSTNSVGVYDWWVSRSKVKISPAFTTAGNIYSVSASVSGATSTDTALEMVLPKTSGQTISNMAVYLNGTPASTSDFRTTNYGLKLRVGSSVSNVQVQYSVEGTNSPPVAVNDTYSTKANTALNQGAPGVLANDSDPEGVVLTAQLASGPTHGALTLNSNGSFAYTPAANYTGSDSFSYRASDGTSSSVATAAISVLPNVTVVLSSISINPVTVAGGTASQGTVTLSGPAPSGGIVVLLSDNSSSTNVPANVTVPYGKTSTTFAITTTTVTSSRTVSVSAVYGGVTKTATLTVTPSALALSTLAVNPASVRGGTTSLGTVTLNGPAPSGGVVIALSDNSSSASVPANVSVAYGKTSATFTITTTSVYSTRTVTISASFGGVTKTATLTVQRRY